MLKNTLGWMAAVLLCTGCSQVGSVVGKAPPDLAMPNQIDVVFNHNPRSRYRSPLTGDWRNGDDMEAWLIEAIDGATEEVLVAIQELILPRLAKALIAAQQRGIRVAVVLEHNYRQTWSEQRPSRLNPRERQRWHQLNLLTDSDRDCTTTADEAIHRDAVALLQTANVPLIDDTEDGGSGLVHHKFAVIDNQTVITGSFNWSPSAAHTNDETLPIIHSPKLAAHFARKMDRL